MSSRVVLLRVSGDGCSGTIAFECNHFHLLSVSDLLLALSGRFCWIEDKPDALRLRGADDVAALDADAGDWLP